MALEYFFHYIFNFLLHSQKTFCSCFINTIITFSNARLGKQSLYPCSRNWERSACCHGCCFLFRFRHQSLANQVSRLFYFLTNQCSRLKTHPGFLLLWSFISNFDFVVLTSSIVPLPPRPNGEETGLNFIMRK